MKGLRLVEVKLQEINQLIHAHVATLAYPLDSWLEDRLFEADIYKLMLNQKCAGYAAINKDLLQFFYVRQEYFHLASTILETVVEEKIIQRIFVISQDTLLNALIAEWNFDRKPQAWFFTDSQRVIEPRETGEHVQFIIAAESDLTRIREIAGEFFDETGGGFSSLAERVAGGTVFLLQNPKSLLGCGIIEKSRLNTRHVSIGMFTNPYFRHNGVATTILLKLKEWVYTQHLLPLAGCWYYNTLSRKSLEAAGMMATAVGFVAVLKGKEKLPLGTVSPSGELVEVNKG
ncbi:MAG: hypothetical protein NUK65_09695 [Firmicutes bacterium]|nr:hypothetical protein [Bacillota bacterium]